MTKPIKPKKQTNWLMTIVLCLGTVTVFFPLYMALVIAFKKPSEMTNSVQGALGFPKELGFDNFAKAMEVTDFWNTLGNSLLITISTIVLGIIVYSLVGYVLGRTTAKSKHFKLIYL